jgi:peptidyl-tRNA hydrolase
MKHICIINSSLKMSKGKACRVCLHLGFRSNFIVNPDMILRWENLGSIGVVLKENEDNLNKIKEKLKVEKISFVMHIDTGLTEVPQDSFCGISFFLNNDQEDMFNDLKLL